MQAEDSRVPAPCPSLEQWCSYLDGSAGGAEKQRLADHLQGCDRCFAAVGSLRQTLAASTSEAPPSPTPPDLLARASMLMPQRGHTRRYVYAAAAVLALCIGGLWWVGKTPPAATDSPLLVEAPPPAPELGFVISRATLPAKGQLGVLLLFARFRDEAGDQVPGFAHQLLDPQVQGSFVHFYHAMSFGQLSLRGEVVEKRYVSRRAATAYVASRAKEDGGYGEFALEILANADQDIDFGQFDNNGPDGRPNSGDDDGVVDYVFIDLISTPRNFILGGATGIAGLGFSADYVTRDRGASGQPILISGIPPRGAMFAGGTFSQTVGVMAHEFGHGLGLPDLYDLAYGNPEEDSGGIGKWGLMGWGASGWKGDDGPSPMCAKSREFLGWIGQDNDRLIELKRDTTGIRLRDLDQGGVVYKVPLRSLVVEGDFLEEEYLLLEYRNRTGNYYNRNLPAEGLLIWHIRPHAFMNTEEGKKMVDLICADGTYEDKGYPSGRTTRPYSGRDNLDFWAHDESYCEAHQGNLGDATDLFDGVRFTHFDLGSNPSTNVEGGYPPSAFTGLAIRNIRSQGSEMTADVSLPHWAGVIRQQVHWIGEILVDGDLTIAPEGELVIYDNTRVRFAGSDRLRSGRDLRRCELIVEGRLRVETPRLAIRDRQGKRRTVKSTGIVFESLNPGQSWTGIFPAAKGVIDLPEKGVLIRGAQFGLRTGVGAQAAAKPAGEEGAQPASFKLLPNYPNPFNQQTTIPYTLAERAQVRLVIYNALGQVVRTLVDETQEAGDQEVAWDGQDQAGREVASGIYLCRLEVVGKYAEARRMSLVR